MSDEPTRTADDGGAAVRRAVATTVPGSDARAVWLALAEHGVLDRLYPHGPDPDRAVLETLLTALDARHRPGVVLSVCVQAASAFPLLCAVAGHEPLAARCRSGTAVVALATTDAAASGSAVLDGGTAVALSGDELVLTGGKRWITNAGHCNGFLVLARHRPARHFTSFCWVLVPAGQPGLHVECADSRYFDGAAVGHVRFDDVRLPATHLLGRPGRAMAEFALRMATERLAGALWARALCRRVLADTRRHLAARPSDGGTLWDNAAVRERFARCLVEWSRLDAMCAAQQGTVPSATAGMALKIAYAESADRILGACADLRGADAFGAGDVADVRAEAAMFGIAGGASGALLAGLADRADDLLGSPS